MDRNDKWCMEREGRQNCGMLLTPPSPMPLLYPWVLDNNKPELPKEILAYSGDWITQYLRSLQDFGFPRPTSRPRLFITTCYISEHTFAWLAKTNRHIKRWKNIDAKAWWVVCTVLCIQPGSSLGSPVPSKHKLLAEAGQPLVLSWWGCA